MSTVGGNNLPHKPVSDPHHGGGRDGIEETLRDPSPLRGTSIQKEGDERLNEALNPSGEVTKPTERVVTERLLQFGGRNDSGRHRRGKVKTYIGV